MNVKVLTPDRKTVEPGRRVAKAQWLLHGEPILNRGPVPAVSLTIVHSRKQFVATLTPVNVEKQQFGEVEAFWLLSGVNVLRLDAPRYSAKGLANALDAAVDTVLALLDAGNPKVTALFNGEGGA